ncbi:hypothetical protein PInf_004609 [Phytophthora infestans]|nr:hypothetical protein PInf_004609 [Phytophthora infestans]
MVRVPGSFGDLGFHRESQEDAQVKIDPGEEASSEVGSTKTLLNETRSADRWSFGRNSVDGREVDPDPDLEEKPLYPPQVPSGTPADLDASQDPLTKQGKVKAKRYAFADLPVKPTLYLNPTPLVEETRKKTKTSKTTRKKMQAPESEEDQAGSRSSWSDKDLEFVYRHQALRDFLHQDPVMQILNPRQIEDPREPVRAPTKTANKLVAVKDLLRLLTESGIVAGVFDAEDIFELDLDLIVSATWDLFARVKSITGERSRTMDPVSSPRIRQAASSNYESAAEDESDTSSEPRRMTLGPSGASMLEARARSRGQEVPVGAKAQDPVGPTRDLTQSSHDRARSGKKPVGLSSDRAQGNRLTDPVSPVDQTATGSSDTSSGTLQRHFEAAMSRFLAEQWFYDELDPDDLDGPQPGQRVRISAISDLKGFTGKDQDEDRARTWISKVKSALTRDQASDAEKCLTFADLLAGPARNWYRQLGRSTRNKWPDLLRSFQTQYCGLEVSVARQYYHARRRSDEFPLEYLHRLNVAGLRAKLKIRDGGSKVLREHVDHFIETLGDVDLADRLILLRLPDADELEEVLRAVDRAKHRQKKAAVGSGKYRQKAPTPTASARRVHQVTAPDSGTESGSDCSDSDPEDYRRVCLTASNDRTAKTGDNSRPGDTVPGDRKMYRSRDLMDGAAQVRCSQCGSRKHTESGCWKHLVCMKCGKKGHPGDHCFYVCRGCGEIHDVGKCLMEEFYNQIRQWFDPAKHRGMLPEVTEKMLN